MLDTALDGESGTISSVSGSSLDLLYDLLQDLVSTFLHLLTNDIKMFS